MLRLLLNLSAGCSLNFVRFLTRRQEGTHQSSSLKETDKRNQSLSAMQQPCSNITWVVSRTLSLSLSTLEAELRFTNAGRFQAPAGSFGFFFSELDCAVRIPLFNSLVYLMYIYFYIARHKGRSIRESSIRTFADICPSAREKNPSTFFL